MHRQSAADVHGRAGHVAGVAGTEKHHDGGNLFRPADPAKFEKIKGEDARACAGFALFAAFPPRMVVVRAADGGWQAVY